MNTWSKRSALAVASALCLTAVVAGPAVAGVQDSTSSGQYGYGVNREDEGYVRQNGYIYAYATDVNDPDGVKSVAANLATIGLPSLGYDISNFWLSLAPPDDWYTPNYGIRLKSALPEGTYPWSVNVTDNNGDVTTFPKSVIVDNTPPKAADVQTANGGSTTGKAELGDKVTISFTDNNGMGMRPANETPRNMVVHIDNNGSNDILKLFIETNNREDYYFGQVQLGKDYVSASRQFGATGTKSTVVRSGNSYVLTLGTPSGSTNTVTSSAMMKWTTASAIDKAGNGVAKVTVNETGMGDREF
jgi:hypothetical protein